MPIQQNINHFSPDHTIFQSLLFDVAALKSQNALITLDTFYLYEAKQDGVSQGGVYKDTAGTSWMIKEPQWGELGNGVREFVAGGLFQSLLGDYAPKTCLVYDTQNHELMVGSKFFNNFQTISDIVWGDYSVSSDIAWNNCSSSFYFDWPDISYSMFMPEVSHDIENDKDVFTPAQINGKPINNYTNVLASVVFLNDGDAHQGNMGLIEEQDAYMFAKIDHGFALNKDYWVESKVTLQDFAWEAARYDVYDLDRLGYDNMYQSIKMVVDMPFDEIEALVSSKIEEARPYIEQWQQDHEQDTPIDDYDAWILSYNKAFSLDNLKMEVLDMLETRQQSFTEILQDLELDHAIFTNDVEALQNLFSAGVDFSKPIFPFHSSASDVFSFEEQKPLELAKSYHSDEVSEFIKDIIASDLPSLTNDISLDNSFDGSFFQFFDCVYNFPQDSLSQSAIEPSIVMLAF